jgi:hypothetical protein
LKIERARVSSMRRMERRCSAGRVLLAASSVVWYDPDVGVRLDRLGRSETVRSISTASSVVLRRRKQEMCVLQRVV